LPLTVKNKITAIAMQFSLNLLKDNQTLNHPLHITPPDVIIFSYHPSVTQVILWMIN